MWNISSLFSIFVKFNRNKSKNIDFVVKFDGNLNDKGQSAYYIWLREYIATEP